VDSQISGGKHCLHLVPEVSGNWYSLARISYRTKSCTLPPCICSIGIGLYSQLWPVVAGRL